MQMMIKFTLRCNNDHEFEAWFGSSAEYDRQKEAGLVTCVICDDHHISKALMTPNLGAKGNKAPAQPDTQNHSGSTQPAPSKSGYAGGKPGLPDPLKSCGTYDAMRA